MVLHSRTLIKLRDSCGRTVFVAPTLKSVGETILGHKLLTSFCSLKLKLKLAIQGLGKYNCFVVVRHVGSYPKPHWLVLEGTGWVSYQAASWDCFGDA